MRVLAALILLTVTGCYSVEKIPDTTDFRHPLDCGFSVSSVGIESITLTSKCGDAHLDIQVEPVNFRREYIEGTRVFQNKLLVIDEITEISNVAIISSYVIYKDCATFKLTGNTYMEGNVFTNSGFCVKLNGNF